MDRFDAEKILAILLASAGVAGLIIGVSFALRENPGRVFMGSYKLLTQSEARVEGMVVACAGLALLIYAGIVWRDGLGDE